MTEPGSGRSLEGCSPALSSQFLSKLRAIPPAATRWQACLLPWLDTERIPLGALAQLGRGRRGGPLLVGDTEAKTGKETFLGYLASQAGPQLEPGVLSPGPRPVLLPSSSQAILPSHPCGHLPGNLGKEIQDREGEPVL